MLALIMSASGALVARPPLALSVRPRHGTVRQCGSWLAMQLQDENMPLPAGEPILVGDPLQVFIDTEEEEGSVWARATVDRVDPASGEFMVMVTEWDRLDPEDDRYAEAYEEGPYTAAEEGEEWRRARRRPKKTLAGFVSWNLQRLQRAARSSADFAEERDP